MMLPWSNPVSCSRCTVSVLSLNTDIDLNVIVCLLSSSIKREKRPPSPDDDDDDDVIILSDNDSPSPPMNGLSHFKELDTDLLMVRPRYMELSVPLTWFLWRGTFWDLFCCCFGASTPATALARGIMFSGSRSVMWYLRNDQMFTCIQG